MTWRAVLIVLVLGQAGCRRNVYLSLAPEASPSKVVFTLSEKATRASPTQFVVFEVVSCGSEQEPPPRTEGVAWRILQSGTIERYATRIEYGSVPDGFSVEVGPLLLQPGCYVAHAAAAGTAVLRFQLTADSVYALGD